MKPERLSKPFHPTQKPVKLLEHIIKVASNPNNIVYDPFMGVGSTGEAALKLGRQFIGTEIEKMYYDAAEQRLKNIVLNNRN